MNLKFFRAILPNLGKSLSVPKQSYLFLIDPIVLSRLPLKDFTLLEPESNFFLGILDAVGAVADIAADIDGVVTIQLFVSFVD
jgi:hypothetical protein